MGLFSGIVDVQQVVGLFLGELFVERIEDRVRLRGLDERAAVGFVQTLGAGVLLRGQSARLARAADAAAGAGHDLDEVKMLLSGFHLCDQAFGVGKAVDHADADGLIADVQLRSADRAAAAQAGMGDGLQRVSRFIRHDATRHCFRDTAGRAEDDACAGAETERHVGRFTGQIIEADTGLLDQLDRSDFYVGKYISLEAKIAKNKDLYYDALAQAQIGWHEGTEDVVPFIKYLLGTILAAYKDVEDRMALVETKLPALEMVRRASKKRIGRFNKQDIRELCPTLSDSSIEGALRKLVAAGELKKEERGKNTCYFRLN